MRATRRRGIESKKRLYGRLFVLPWEIGLILFFAIPIFQSVRFAFSNISFGDGLVIQSAGFEHFDYIFNRDANFIKNLTSAVGSFLYAMPIIVVVSLIFALILNQKFRGRLVFRAIFFFPVIIATGSIQRFLTADKAGQPLMMSVTGEGNPYAAGSIDFNRILMGFQLPDDITALLATYIGMIFNLVWSSGIPILLFIAALQTIPPQLYEASDVEGATAWEAFWYITFPSIGNMLVLVVIYVMIDLFTAENNPVMYQAYSLMTGKQIYDESSAMLWAYFMIIGIITALFLYLYNRTCLRRWR